MTSVRAKTRCLLVTKVPFSSTLPRLLALPPPAMVGEQYGPRYMSLAIVGTRVLVMTVVDTEMRDAS